MVIRKETYTLHFLDGRPDQQYPNHKAAMNAAAQIVGNNSWARPIITDNTFLFGPGDGTTSIMVRQDVDFVDGR